MDYKKRMHGVTGFLVSSTKVIVLIALILGALYVAVGRLLVTHSDFRTELEGLLEARFGVPVQTGSVEGSWIRLDPILQISDIRIGSLDSPALSGDKAIVRISSLLSLINGRLVLTEIEILNSRFELQEQTPGKWKIKGIQDSGKPLSLDRILDLSAHLDVVRLIGFSIKLDGQRSDYMVSSSDDKPIEFQSLNDQKVVSITVSLVREVSHETDQPGPSEQALSELNLIAEFSGDYGEEDFSGRFYIGISQLQMLDFLHPTGPLKELETIGLNSLAFTGGVWADFDGINFNLRGDVEIESTSEIDKGNMTINGNVAFGALGAPGSLQLYGDAITLNLMGNTIQVRNASTAIEQDSDGIKVGIEIPKLDLGELVSAIQTINTESPQVLQRILSNYLPNAESGKLNEFISGTSPEGVLTSTIGVVGFGDTLRELRITSNLQGGDVLPYGTTPGFSNLDGMVSFGLDSGYIDIDSRQSDLHIKSTFQEAWPIDSLRGRINYHFDNDQITLSSGLIEFSHDDLSAYGKLMVNYGGTKEQHAWGLIIGAHNGDLSEVGRFFPNTLTPEFLSWLKQSVKDGTVIESGFLFHGAMARSEPRIKKAFDIFFQVADGVLDYHPDWPELFDLSAMVRAGHSGVSVKNSTSKILNSDVLMANLRVPIPVVGMADTVYVDARVQGTLSDVISVLNETPVAEKISFVARDWTGLGDITGKVSLEIPTGERRDETILSDVRLVMSGNEVNFSDYDLNASDFSGEIRYENTTGLTSTGFSAVLFDESINGSIASELSEESGEVTIDFSGLADARTLYQWSGQKLLSRATGKSEYNVAIHIPFGQEEDRTWIEATSTLVGTHLDFPKPLEKDSNAQRNLYYRQEFLEPGYQVDLELEDLSSTLNIQDGLIKGGQVHFGPGKPDETRPGKLIDVTGSLSQVSYQAWEEFLDEMTLISDVSIKSELAKSIGIVSLDIGTLSFYSLDLEDAATRITRDSDTSWTATISSDVLQGSVTIPDDDVEPLVIDLDYLRFPDSEDVSDPMDGVDPKELGKIDFSTRELMSGDKHYGNWSFQLRPHETGAKFDNITALVRGVTLMEGAELSWIYTGPSNGGLHGSVFNGSLAVADLESALTAWGYASSIEGENFHFDASLHWDGSPVAFDLDIVEGQVRLDNENGRFVQAQTGTGALKLLGIFDFAQIGRRFRFDFSDVVQKGWSFNKISGVASFNQGIVEVSEPVVIEGSSTILKVGGNLDLISRQLGGDLIVTLPLNRNLPWYAAYSLIATGPLAGAGVLLAREVLETQINQMSSAKYKVTGTLEEPKIEFVSIFNDSVREVGDNSTVQ